MPKIILIYCILLVCQSPPQKKIFLDCCEPCQVKQKSKKWDCCKDDYLIPFQQMLFGPDWLPFSTRWKVWVSYHIPRLLNKIFILQSLTSKHANEVAYNLFNICLLVVVKNQNGNVKPRHSQIPEGIKRTDQNF